MEMVIMCIVGFFMFIIGVTAFWQYFKSHEMIIGDLNTRITTWFGILVGYLLLSYIITVYITAAIMYALDFLASIILWIIGIVAVITIIGLTAYVYTQKKEQENFDTRPYYIGIAVIAIIAAVIFGFAIFSSSNNKALPTQNKVSAVEDNQKSTQNNPSFVNNNQKATKNDNNSINTKQNETKSQTANDNSRLKKAAQELSQYSIKGEVTETSYGHNGKGFLAKYGEHMLAFCDKANNRGVTILPPNTAQEIANYKGSSNKKIRFTLYIPNATKDKDSVHGRWSNNDHYFPIEVEFKFENGKHVPGMIKSGLGEPTSNYDKYLYETKNVEMVNLIIEEAAHLK